MTKKQTNKQQERRHPLPQATQAGVTELTDADLEQVQGGQKKKFNTYLTFDAVPGSVTKKEHPDWIE